MLTLPLNAKLRCFQFKSLAHLGVSSLCWFLLIEGVMSWADPLIFIERHRHIVVVYLRLCSRVVGLLLMLFGFCGRSCAFVMLSLALHAHTLPSRPLIFNNSLFVIKLDDLLESWDFAVGQIDLLLLLASHSLLPQSALETVELTVSSSDSVILHCLDFSPQIVLLLLWVLVCVPSWMVLIIKWEELLVRGCVDMRKLQRGVF